MERIKNLIRDDNRGVSPVIGVILMVAITVILAAVIGTFVLNLGGSVSSNAQAGITYDASSDTVTLTSLGSNTDGVYCASSGSDLATATQNATSVGDTFTCAAGENIVGETADGEQTVIRTNLP